MEEVISGMVGKGLAENAFSICFNSKDEKLWMSYVNALDRDPSIFEQIDIAGMFFLGGMIIECYSNKSLMDRLENLDAVSLHSKITWVFSFAENDSDKDYYRVKALEALRSLRDCGVIDGLFGADAFASSGKCVFESEGVFKYAFRASDGSVITHNMFEDWSASRVYLDELVFMNLL
jgi:hypothetical protein